MRIGLISDTHIPEACETLWPEVFEAFDGVEAILHAGDIHEFRVLDELGEIAPVFAARGNGEDGSGGRPVQPDDDRVREGWLLEFGGVSIGLTHFVPVPEFPPRMTLARWSHRFFGGVMPDVIVSGDTHVEAVVQIGATLCVNPGSPTYPHNYSVQRGTIGFLDIHEGQVSAEVCLLTSDGYVPFDWKAPLPWR